MPAVVVTTPAQERVLDAACELIARWGVAKTTVGDVARETGISRATLYRAFPGGRDEVLDLLARRELARVLGRIGAAVDAAPDAATALAAALHTAAISLRDHAAVQSVLTHEPHLAVPVLGLAELDRLLALARRALAPHLVAHLGEQAAWAAEWMARLFVSTLVSPTSRFDLTDRAVCARLATRYLAPGLAAAAPRPPSLSLSSPAVLAIP